ncbi:kinase-like domain-containing protein [Leucosporidium creatinivorum]|uniref:Kinase-like domain-containing protein n=1 Tax=Leucosporidium creatinivorum TaxID=106004 RepID=A0A1Y2E4Z7_9BASI|nr:kinase-like domain-containing protein [Leucosporidium creatinivorum]
MSVDPTSSPQPGAHFHLQYEPLELIGAGGFGFVLKVARRADGTQFAVKLILKSRMARGGLIRSKWEAAPGLEQWSDGTLVVPLEAYIMRKATHESVVGFVDLFADVHYFYLVMEHHGASWRKPDAHPQAVRLPPTPPLTPPTPSFPLHPDTLARPGYRRSPSLQSLGFTTISNPPSPVSTPMFRRSSSSDLFECIEAHNSFSETIARGLFKQVVNVVCDLRLRGICHRDIKDENLVVDANGIVKLIDFGSAILFDPSLPLPLFDRFAGTTNAAPAEVLNCQPFQLFPAEIWSLGVLLSILLTGSAPFPTREAAKRGQRVSTRGRLSPAVEDLLNACFLVDPKERITLEEIQEHPWMSPKI